MDVIAAEHSARIAARTASPIKAHARVCLTQRTLWGQPPFRRSYRADCLTSTIRSPLRGATAGRSERWGDATVDAAPIATMPSILASYGLRTNLRLAKIRVQAVCLTPLLRLDAYQTSSTVRLPASEARSTTKSRRQRDAHTRVLNTRDRDRLWLIATRWNVAES